MSFRQVIEVGPVSKTFETIGVGIELDFCDDDPSDKSKSLEHFRMIEIDGFFLVSVESFFVSGRSSEVDYKCFLTINDAYEYLEMYGVTDGCKEDLTEREDSDRQYE